MNVWKEAMEECLSAESLDAREGSLDRSGHTRRNKGKMGVGSELGFLRPALERGRGRQEE